MNIDEAMAEADAPQDDECWKCEQALKLLRDEVMRLRARDELATGDVIAIGARLICVFKLADEWSKELGDVAPWEAADHIFEALGLPKRGHPHENNKL